MANGQLGVRHHSAPYLSSFQWFGFSSAASPQPNSKENGQSGNKHEKKTDNQAASADKNEASTSNVEEESGAATEPQSNASGTNRRRGGTKRTAFSDSESDSDLEDLSKDDLLKLVVEKEQLLGRKQEELEQMKDKMLRTLADLENFKERSRRESENTKKFAIQVLVLVCIVFFS